MAEVLLLNNTYKFIRHLELLSHIVTRDPDAVHNPVVEFVELLRRNPKFLMMLETYCLNWKQLQIVFRNLKFSNETSVVPITVPHVPTLSDFRRVLKVQHRIENRL